MSLTQTFYRIGAAITLATTFASVGLDLASEHRAEEKITAANIPVMDRLHQCQAENQQCETDSRVLRQCIEAKADKRVLDINSIIKQRDEEKAVYRSAMGFTAAYFIFLLALARRQTVPSAKPPQPL